MRSCPIKLQDSLIIISCGMEQLMPWFFCIEIVKITYKTDIVGWVG